MKRLGLLLVLLAGAVACVGAQTSARPAPTSGSLEDALSDHSTPHELVADLAEISSTAPTAGCPSCALVGSSLTVNGDGGIDGILQVNGNLISGAPGTTSVRFSPNRVTIDGNLMLDGGILRSSDGADRLNIATPGYTTLGGDGGMPGAWNFGGPVTVQSTGTAFTGGDVATRNAIQIANAAAASNPTITAVGTDTNITIGINPKGSGSVQFQSGQVAINSAGKQSFPSTDSSGTPGAVTINKPSGKFAVAAAAGSVVITNSLVLTSSIVLVNAQTTDATCTLAKSVIPAAGSFTVTMNNTCTAATTYGFVVIN